MKGTAKAIRSSLCYRFAHHWMVLYRLKTYRDVNEKQQIEHRTVNMSQQQGENSCLPNVNRNDKR